MLRLVLSLTFLLGFGSAFAKECAVYGISDSPQSLNCSFPKTPEVQLRCSDGKYSLNTKDVLVAFHMDVERGPVPLVFRAPESSLTVMIHSPKNIVAYLNKDRRDLSGKCKIGN